nr:hypothetical protein [Tanacetum cinerariifolium]
MLVQSSNSAKRNVIKGNDWLVLTQGMTRVYQRNTPIEDFYTKFSGKEAQSVLNDWIAMLEIRAVVGKVSTSSSTLAISSKVSEHKDMVRALLLDKKNQSSAPTSSSTPAPVKAIDPNCVTCGGAHSYQNCPATSGNVYQDNIQEYVSQAAAANYNQGNTGF